MKKEKERKHLNKLWKKMQQHFKSFIRRQDPEALHQFRVQVKKTRSFLTLLAEHKKNESLLKNFKPVKKIFRSAGVIRDSFLHQQQGKDHRINDPDFYEEQAGIQKEETEKLVSKGKKHLHKMKTIRDKLQQLHPIAANEIQSFYREQLHHTHQLLAQHNFSEQLHEARKMLKHLLYNEQVVQSDIAKKLNINFSYIDELQHVLGQWHDNKLALAFFNNKLDSKGIDSIQAKNKELEEVITAKARDFEKQSSNNK